MEITFLKIKEQESLKKEPYKSIADEFQKMDSIEGKKIEIDIEKIFQEKENCFYTQGYCFDSGKLSVEFESINNPENYRNNILVIVKLKLQLSCSDDRDTYEMAIRCIKRKFPYFYISDASHLSLQCNLDDEFLITFAALTSKENSLNTCNLLVNQLIAIFCQI